LEQLLLILSDDFDFDEWLLSVDLCVETVDKLKAAKVCDIKSILLLSPYDITALKIDIGDRGKFRSAIKRLRDQHQDDDQVLNATVNTEVASQQSEKASK
jgi:hypothetical protein